MAQHAPDSSDASTQPAAVASTPAAVGNAQLRVIPRAEHAISRKDLSPAAVKVLYRLINAGYEAYAVGGCLRDLLLGETPKDFDVATSARPEEIKALFRGARLIGRRFRLAHVRVGGETIEVSTFRSQAVPDAGADGDDAGGLVLSSAGMIVEDNVYGSKDEDALRRDFTINALYYTPKDFTLHEYQGALTDLAERSLRTIGQPAVRFREDPVRMLRAVRLAAKLGLTISPDTLAPIPQLAHLLRGVPPARLFDELQKMLLGGASEPTWALLRSTGLLDHLLPDTAAVTDPRATRLLELAMRNTDNRIRDDRPVTPGFLFAVLLWPPLRARLASADYNHDEVVAAAIEVISRQNGITSVPARFGNFAREVWDLQPRLERAHPRRVRALLEHPRFRAAYDFLVLRTAAGELSPERAAFWTAQQGPDQPADELLATLPDADDGDDPPPTAPLPARRRRRRRSRSRGVDSGSNDANSTDSTGAPTSDP